MTIVRARTAAIVLLSAPLALPAVARSRGYSVEAAAGVSQGSSVQTSYDAHPYHPFRDFGQKAPPMHGGARLVPQSPGAQDQGDRESHPERMGLDPNATYETVVSSEAPPAEEPPREFTADDAAANFPALVETFLRKNGEDGVWTAGEGGRARRFTLVSADAKRLRKLKPGVYAGPVLLREVPGGRPVVAEAAADFAGAEWRVVWLKLGAEPAAAKAARQR